MEVLFGIRAYIFKRTKCTNLHSGIVMLSPVAWCIFSTCSPRVPPRTHLRTYLLIHSSLEHHQIRAAAGRRPHTHPFHWLHVGVVAFDPAIGIARERGVMTLARALAVVTPANDTISRYATLVKGAVCESELYRVI
jgi:hypothetical protein